MGKATGKTFEEWLEDRNGGGAALSAFMNGVYDRSRVKAAVPGGTLCSYDPPPRRKKGTREIVNPEPFEFTIGDDQHGFASVYGNEFHYFAAMVGLFLAQGGVIEDVSDPFHDDEG